MLRKTVFALSICLSLTACETMGSAAGDKYSTAALRENLKVGVTTPEEVRALYGKPDYTVDGPNGPEYWAYNVDDDTNSLISQAASFLPYIPGSSAAQSQVTQDRSLNVHFENNRLTSYSLSNTKPR